MRDATRIDLCGYPIGTLVKKDQDCIINIIVEQDNTPLGTTDKVADISVSIKDLPVVEDAFHRRQSGVNKEVYLLLRMAILCSNRSKRWLML